MVWINKDTGVVLSKDGHTLFVDLVAEDEERELDWLQCIRQSDEGRMT